MASITYWSQLQPSPRQQAITAGLAARIRDPAWLLCRQWQLGEYQGIDGGSPAFARIGFHTAPIVAAQLGTSKAALKPGQLLEPFVEAEPLTADLATCVELGQTFELLSPAGLHASFRTAYPIAAAGPNDDPATARFRAVCSGRAIDGFALYTAAKAAQKANKPLPDKPAIPAAFMPGATEAIAAFIEWVEATWGQFGNTEPPAWDATRLDYGASVSAGKLTLEANPDAEAALDWYALDLVSGDPPAVQPSLTSVMPGHVRFRGMPSPRWWDFETSKTDFGAIAPDSRDLAKLLFADFLLIHGDDWYLAPLDIPSGSLCWIDSLTVTDVFGVTNAIPRADAMPGNDWTVFSTTDTRTGSPAPFLVAPASAIAAALEGDPIEEVHLLRDETADMAWAVERVAEDAVGRPQTLSSLPSSGPVPNAPAPLAYQLASALPDTWFPLLPVQTEAGGLALVAGTVEGGALSPSTRIVRRLSVAGFQLPDHELSRAGLRIERVVCRVRGTDGTAQLWVARRRQLGAGEASSGLRYDQGRSTGA
jgi:hypothetical protein